MEDSGMSYHEFSLKELEKYSLEPCPFCGRSDELSINVEDEHGSVPEIGEAGVACVYCCECGGSGPEVWIHRDNWKDTVIAIWNKRGLKPGLAS
jgi:hypothetical protein